MIAGITDLFGFGFSIILLIGLPAIGFGVNFGGLKRHGLNRRAAYASAMFFLTLMVQGATITLSSAGSFNSETAFYIIAATGVMNIIGGLWAVAALWQIRRKPHRWPRGRKRAAFAFWLNVIALVLMGAVFYIRTRPDLEQRIFGGSPG